MLNESGRMGPKEAREEAGLIKDVAYIDQNLNSRGGIERTDYQNASESIELARENFEEYQIRNAIGILKDSVLLNKLLNTEQLKAIHRIVDNCMSDIPPETIHRIKSQLDDNNHIAMGILADFLDEFEQKIRNSSEIIDLFYDQKKLLNTAVSIIKRRLVIAISSLIIESEIN